MKSNNLPFRYLVLALLSFLLPSLAIAQTNLRGHITDAATHEPLPSVSVTFPGSSEGTVTDADGNFELNSDKTYTSAQISFIGYKTVTKSITNGQVLSVALTSDEHSLQGVIVKPKKTHYHNKNNPAVALIDLVVANRDRNRLTAHDFVQYDQYEKMMFSFSNSPEKLKKNILFRKFKFMTENLDTTTLPGKALLPWYIQEQAEKVYYRKNPEKKKTIVTGDKRVDFGDFVDNAGLNAFMKHMYQDIDIYQNNINVVTNQFLSPIANGAPSLYKYFITDTVVHDGVKWVELSFFPRNKMDMLFQGKIYVTLDGRFAVPHVDMTVNKDINLNWVKNLHIILDFDRNADSTWRLTKSSMLADFGITRGSKGGIFGERTVNFSNYTFGQPLPDSVYAGQANVVLKDASTHDAGFWTGVRTDSLSAQEAQTYANVEQLTASKTFKHIADVATLLLAGYKKAGPYYEVGPVSTFYSFNPVEGFRLRLGGRTLPSFSKRFYTEEYAAYGFKDKQWKYFVSGTYSFNGGSVYKFPQNFIRASYQRDVSIPGQELQFIEEDNFLLSFKRGVNNMFTYNDIYRLKYIREFKSHFSYELDYKNWKQSPAGGLVYIPSDASTSHTPLQEITTSEVGLQLRYAPHEEFYQGKLYRTPIINRYPIITLRTNIGIKDLLGGQYNYQSATLNVYKHFYMAQFGYSDVVVEGGYIFGSRVPFPLLDIHHANQSYGFQLQSYNLMNFLEFASDHYASIFIDHCFNGFIFNRVPLLKRLGWRENLDFKSLWGGIRDQNDPAKHEDLLKFPTDAAGNPTTFALGSTPYVEGSVGVSNIFKFFRVDYVHRFTYLNHPNVAANGVRFLAQFNF